eukprot:CAMPEP_0204908674 /NCGR_PEP_ID=MMETSP1397-20131031/7578_1 /ASSEMBLY_ACC=CAM_ASM_000891 /TAXON_ID=49980 /ORGANISM="Climacostomum Climacostomum virens, Strain Stock W-24" /LENGTH=189 /DNA_ID=CAMNT_0052078283 /DNA_START=1 /DNA_END=570 /DNA_ORIENTATION=+
MTAKRAEGAQHIKTDRQLKQNFSDSYGKQFTLKDSKPLKKVSSMSFASLMSPSERSLHKHPTSPQMKTTTALDIKRHYSPEAERTQRKQGNEIMQLLNKRTLELNQVMLEKMRLEERLLRLHDEVLVLKSENEQLKANSVPLLTMPTKLSTMTTSEKKQRVKLKTPELEQYMESFRKKLKKFIRITSES